MPMEPSADSLSNTLSRLNLSSYTALLVDDEELTSKLILTMERGAALTSLVDVGMDGASAEKLCAALFDGVIAADDDDDALVIEDNDADDGLVMEENDEADASSVAGGSGGRLGSSDAARRKLFSHSLCRPSL